MYIVYTCTYVHIHEIIIHDWARQAGNALYIHVHVHGAISMDGRLHCIYSGNQTHAFYTRVKHVRRTCTHVFTGDAQLRTECTCIWHSRVQTTTFIHLVITLLLFVVFGEGGLLECLCIKTINACETYGKPFVSKVR